MKSGIQLSLLSVLLVVSQIASAKITEIDQENKAFTMDGNVVTTISVHVGDQLLFANKDKVYHNIFSMSDISKFNFGAFAKGDSKSYTFNKPGKAKIECAIHPRMVLDVKVQ